VLAALAALGSLGLNFGLARAGERLGWCDWPSPDDTLKVHKRPVPWTGGMGVLGAFCAGVVFVGLRPLEVWGWLVIAVLSWLVGVWDDLVWKGYSRPWRKLALQVVCAGVCAGVWTRWRACPWGVWGVVVAGLVLVAAMNALNLEDGLDGVAGGEALVSALGLAVVFYQRGRNELALVSLVLAGALAGFLVLNWHPAQVFLGDSGAHLVGAVLASLGLSLGFSGIALLGVPVLDMVWVVVRRFFRGRPLLVGDRSHLYDLLRRAGLSVATTALVMMTGQVVVVAVVARLLVGGK